MRVALLVVATGKYIDFLPNLLESANNFFLKNCKVDVCVFSDAAITGNFRLFKIEHKPWPHATLKRFHFFKQYKKSLRADFFFYIDVDTLFVAPVTDEILSERTAVRHCGFLHERGTYENRKESTSYVSGTEGEFYLAGGFWGFSRKEFWKLVSTAVEMIDTDERNGITPRWNDESVLNRYLIDNPPTKILSPSYHYPCKNIGDYIEWWGQTFEPVILLLEKNHKKIRDEV